VKGPQTSGIDDAFHCAIRAGVTLRVEEVVHIGGAHLANRNGVTRTLYCNCKCLTAVFVKRNRRQPKEVWWASSYLSERKLVAIKVIVVVHTLKSDISSDRQFACQGENQCDICSFWPLNAQQL